MPIRYGVVECARPQGANAGGTAEGLPFVPCGMGMKGLFFVSKRDGPRCSPNEGLRYEGKTGTDQARGPGAPWSRPRPPRTWRPCGSSTWARKGELTAVLKQMGGLSAEERPVIGQLANEVREALTDALARRQRAIEEAALNASLEAETLDVTIPGKRPEVGHKHPMSIALDELKDIFVGMGFPGRRGPGGGAGRVQLHQAEHRGGATPPGSGGDTFYIREDSSLLLRTQTSPMQVRTMEKSSPPIRIIAPGRVYRKDEVDATHPHVPSGGGAWWWTRASPWPT